MIKGLSWWYAAPAMFGAVQLVALPLLIPAHIVELSGSATASGGVLAMIGLGGFLAPVIGGLADRNKWHAGMQLVALLGYAVAFLLLGLVPSVVVAYGATAIVGISSITMLSVNPTFVVAVGYDETEKALRLTRMNQFIFVGAILAGAILAVISDLNRTLSFLVISGAALLAVALTRKDNADAASRLILEPEVDAVAPKGKFTFHFLIFLLAVFGGMMASANQVGQGPNVLINVFQVDAGWVSLALTVSAIISLATLDLGGRLMAKMGAGAIWILGLAIYAIGSGVMGLMAGSAVGLLMIPLLLQLLYMQGLSLVDMAKPALAERATSLAPSTTQGVLLFAIAGGYSFGTLTGGMVGDARGLAAIPTYAAICALVALVLALTSLWMMPKPKTAE